MTPPTAEQIRAYLWAVSEHDRGHGNVTRAHIETFVIALRDTLAELMESEFKREHVLSKQKECGEEEFCSVCGSEFGELDPCHNFTSEQWRQAAEKLYREG